MATLRQQIATNVLTVTKFRELMKRVRENRRGVESVSGDNGELRVTQLFAPAVRLGGRVPRDQVGSSLVVAVASAGP